jgi:hypothetical protein
MSCSNFGSPRVFQIQMLVLRVPAASMVDAILREVGGTKQNL